MLLPLIVLTFLAELVVGLGEVGGRRPGAGAAAADLPATRITYASPG
ncbi:hypothetical protein NKG05_23010 [Oerskovia sp. M15]